VLFRSTDTAAEKLRTIEVKNNVYYWPTALTTFWKAWTDTAHIDSIYTVSWMNTRTTNMFTDKVTWPGFVQSGNQNIDPGYGASIPAVLTNTTTDGVGLLNWFTKVRTGLGTTEVYGYQITQVTTAANWTPTWPLAEATDMKYTNASLKTGATDGGPIGDPYWFNGTTGVDHQAASVPYEFGLSQAYPNPFNPSTNIRFSLGVAGPVTLKVYNILGQEVMSLINGESKAPGLYTVTFNMDRFASGMYVCRLQQGNLSQARKIALVK
jgi:hypothetical protein